MKPKLAWLIIVPLFLVVIAYFYYDWKTKQETIEAERKHVQQQAIKAVAHLKAQHNAVDDWEKKLSRGKNIRIEPILTIELQQLWQVDHPILFIGSLMDISAIGPDSYQLVIERGVINLDFIFVTDLRLSLRAPKATIDAFLDRHPEVRAGVGFNQGIAVVANVSHITAADQRGSNGERVEIKIGHGELLGIVFVGNAYLMKN